MGIGILASLQYNKIARLGIKTHRSPSVSRQENALFEAMFFAQRKALRHGGNDGNRKKMDGQRLASGTAQSSASV
jgi:hypothetical protein